MKRIVLFFGLLLMTTFSVAQTDIKVITNLPQHYELPKTVTLANGKVISYKKWCRQYDRASRRAVRKIHRQMRKELNLK
jgi:hypothetical protein